jgi:hypothetical protein
MIVEQLIGTLSIMSNQELEKVQRDLHSIITTKAIKGEDSSNEEQLLNEAIVEVGKRLNSKLMNSGGFDASKIPEAGNNTPFKEKIY